eukprot:359154-Chlamydomonas_euryale.AAC.10
MPKKASVAVLEVLACEQINAGQYHEVGEGRGEGRSAKRRSAQQAEERSSLPSVHEAKEPSSLPSVSRQGASNE